MTDTWTPPDSLQRAATVVAQAIDEWATPSSGRTWSDERFDSLALQVHAAQYEHVSAYRTWCDYEIAERSIEPGDWRSIPALPIGAFKRTRVAAHPATADTVVWRSSGTTNDNRSFHALYDLTLYDASLRAGARAALGEGPRRRVVQLAPTASVAADSSLSHMFDAIRDELGDDAGAFADASSRVDVDAAWTELERAATDGAPVLLLTTSFALVQLLEQTMHRSSIMLPAGSAVVDTGGYKGRTRELSRNELVAWIGERLNVPAAYCENEYGMSELSTQAWLGTIAAADDAPLIPLRSAPGARWQPPWMRTRVVDPQTLEEVKDGQTGVLVHHDLANIWSCACIRTEDIGRRIGSSYVMLGRLPGAELKGCSLRVEDIL